MRSMLWQHLCQRACLCLLPQTLSMTVAGCREMQLSTRRPKHRYSSCFRGRSPASSTQPWKVRGVVSPEATMATVGLPLLILATICSVAIHRGSRRRRCLRAVLVVNRAAGSPASSTASRRSRGTLMGVLQACATAARRSSAETRCNQGMTWWRSPEETGVGGNALMDALLC